jgi:uridine kinase
MEAMEIPTQSQIRFYVVGGAASGKSTSGRVFKDLAQQLGLDCKDFAKINTDYYRKLLIDESSIDAQDFSKLTSEEALIIHNKIYNRLINLNAKGCCPNTMFDQIYLSQDKIDLALANNGNAFTLGVSRDVGDAVLAQKPEEV